MNKAHLIAQLQEAREELGRLVDRLKELEASEPDGKIGVTRGKYTSFYRRTEKMGKSARYLRKTEPALITALSQKMFNHGLKDAADKELAHVKQCLEILGTQPFGPDNVLMSLPEEIRPFINTDILTDTDKLEKWNNAQKYGTNPIEPANTYTTSNGDKVRSKSEFIIAEMLRNAGVPYFYEKPLARYTGKYDMFPDFTCLNKRTGKTYYWEHFGRMDDPKYSIDAVMKIQNYAALDIFLGTELLISVETIRYPVRTSYISALIEKFLL